MRALAMALTLVLLGMSAGDAAAGPQRPQVKRGTPYATARLQLVAQGFDPVRVLANPRGFGGEPCPRDSLCHTYPELANCAADIPTCLFLFRRRGDGSYWWVDAQDPREDFTPPFRLVRYGGIARADRRDLDGLVVRLRNGRRVSFEEPLPQCSATVWTNCRAPPLHSRR